MQFHNRKASGLTWSVVVAAAASVLGSSAWAADIQWGNVAGGTDWGTGSNWINGVVPGLSDTARIWNTGSGSTNTLVSPIISGAFSVNKLDVRLANTTFGNNTSLSINRSVGISQLTIGAGGIATDNASNSVTLNADIVAGANQTWNSGGGINLTLSSTSSLSGSGNITKTGDGVLSLAGNLANYTGTLTNNSFGAFLMSGDKIVANEIKGFGSLGFGGGVITLTGANTYAGVTTVFAGAARVNSIGSTGATSTPLGTNATIRLGINNSTGSIDYTGAGETTNRTTDLGGGGTAGQNGAGTINNHGGGTIVLAGNVTNSGASSTSTNTLNLLGNVTVTGSVSNASNGGKTALNASGTAGAVRLRSSSNFTGGIGATRGGTMIVDYDNGGAINSANPVVFNLGGNLVLERTTAGNQTLGNLAFTDGTNRLILGKTNLTLGTVGRSSNSGASIVFDLTGGGSLTAATNGTAGSLVDHVIVAGTSNSSFAGFIIRTASGYDFASATSASATPQTIIALGANPNVGATTNFTGTQGTGNTVNGRISASLTTVGSAQTLGTLRIDTTAAAVGTNGAGGTLQLSNSLSLSSSSKNGLLFDGTGNYTISGNGALSAIGFYQYSTGTVTVNSAWGSSTRIDKFGPGLFVNNTSTAFSSSGSLGLNLWEGVYRAGTVNALSGGGRINIGGGGILELTSGSGDLTRSLGTSGTNVAFLGDGGFSAWGGNRTVALGGTASPTNLIWNNTGSFLSNGNKLILSSSTSDSTITLANAIDLNGVRREIAVNDGSASVDAVLSGNLSSNAYSGGSLYKSGTGTLALTGNNTYNGGTTIAAGAVLANSASSTGSGSVAVLSGATLGGNGVIAGSVSVSGTLSPGESAGLLTTGALTLNDGSTTFIELDGTARGVAGGYDAVNVNGAIFYDGTLSIVTSAGAVEGEYNLFDFTNTPSTSFDDVLVSGFYGSGWLNMTPTGFAGTIGSMVFTFTGSNGVLTLSAEAVPEPLTAAGVLLLSARLLGRRERTAM